MSNEEMNLIFFNYKNITSCTNCRRLCEKDLKYPPDCKSFIPVNHICERIKCNSSSIFEITNICFSNFLNCALHVDFYFKETSRIGRWRDN